MKRQGLGSFMHIYMKVVQKKKNIWFAMKYDKESIVINPLGQIIVSIALSAINSPAAPDARCLQ